MSADPSSLFDRRWRLLVVTLWLAACVWLIWSRWGSIHWFALGDTDDNMRIAQVRAWLNGQGWYDLRQYKLNPPVGFDIHWSRLVDLPIAGLILVFRPLVGGRLAEQIAVTVAPLLPLLVALFSAGLAARRLIDPRAALLAAALVLCCQIALDMFRPLRIDHHGWQLAFLLVTIAGLADPQRIRGGITVGVASALSLVIGLELLPYIAVAGASIGLRWIVHREASPRLFSYAATFGLASAIGFGLFASYANRAPVCDALSPVWLSTVLVGCASLLALTLLNPARWELRLATAVLAASAVAAFYWLSWPHCRGRLEGVSPELYKLWLSNVREARPIYAQNAQTIVATLMLPAIGLVGAAWGIWRARGQEVVFCWLSIVVLSLFSVGMLFWQVRAGPAAQLIGAVGAAFLGWHLVRWFGSSQRMLVRVFGVVGAFLLVSGIASYLAFPFLPKEKKNEAYWKKVTAANRRCPTLPALHPIALMPATTIFTFADLGPRIIAVTHHKAVAGPYHRNGQAILDVHHAFDGAPDQARAIARRHGATLLLVCPFFAESTVYRARSPNGFYARLERGERFPWLEPVKLPKNSPYWLWRIR
ncbi:AcrB/AcrD/AcrF family protein [Sphingomonas sp. ID1715]|uniref:AcrB/AcrD/AcrF family protein n=1 Tax=Sphingomonas sp. ID1715 TaxID=1656898 RepID=UPI001489E0AF|nr:AcrB/AcrD/AcrF family protein [Sphingomonas sp. ID1715]NNM78230.1 AcrB/AcrD/AcrF family protein [Sphingomonas sp. ID1715]